jgi:hypothetical protein
MLLHLVSRSGGVRPSLAVEDVLSRAGFTDSAGLTLAGFQFVLDVRKIW